VRRNHGSGWVASSSAAKRAVPAATPTHVRPDHQPEAAAVMPASAASGAYAHRCSVLSDGGFVITCLITGRSMMLRMTTCGRG